MKKSLFSFSVLLLLLLSCGSGGISEESSSFSSFSSSSSAQTDISSSEENKESSDIESSSEETSESSVSSFSSSSELSSTESFSSNEDESSETSSSEEQSSISESSVSSSTSSKEQSSTEYFSSSEDESSEISSSEEQPSISESSVSSSSSEVVPESYSSKYDIIYDLGTRKTSYPFKEGEENLIKECFVIIKDDEEDIISSISSFSNVYGGGYGGSGDNAWLSGNLLKFGTSSANSELTLNLTKKIDKVVITGMVSANTLKVQINDNEIICSDMALANKETVETQAYTTFEVDIDESNILSIKTTNKKVLYISSIELSYQNDSPIITDTYTVTWKNYDETVLETDYEVPSGTTPKYDGTTPTKESDEEYNYVFSGWNPKVGPIYSDTTYMAAFTPIGKDEKIRGTVPILSSDEKTLEYGIYPQNHISDESLINILESLPLDVKNRVIYNNEYYLKATSCVYNHETYTFDNGETIINEKSYWFKCDTIKWKVINNENNAYILLSETLLTSHCFYKDYQNRIIDGHTIYPNNYQESDVLKYINDDFLLDSFFLGSDSIVDFNSNKVSLPSVELINGLDIKVAKTTDYSRSTGAFASKDNYYKHNGSYWTSTVSNNFNYCVYNVNAGGIISEYAVDGSSHSIRPCIKIIL